MSNELVSILQNNPGLVQTGLDEDTLAVAGGTRQSNKRISIKGGVFRKYAGGKEIGAIEDRHMNVIIVKMAHDASRQYYAKGYKEGEKISPVCWSNNSKTPDADVPNPPAASCDSCPHSAKGSGANGMGTACRLSWRLAVVLPNDPNQTTNPYQSQYYWGQHPYMQSLADLPYYNDVPEAPAVPFGLQAGPNFDWNQYLSQLAATPVGPVAPGTGNT